MTLRVFETDDAKYYLGLGRHDKPSAPLFEKVDFSTIDFMVLEGAPDEFDIANTLGFLQYSDLMKRALKENPNLPFYSVDIATNKKNIMVYYGGNFLELIAVAATATIYFNAKDKKDTRRMFLKKSAFAGVTLYWCSGGISFFNSDKEGIPYSEAVTKIRHIMIPGPIIGFRDSLAAKKISEHLVPLHHKPDRKVNAAILYGAAHAGIETKLCYPSLNQNALSLYHNLTGAFSAEEMNTIGVIQQENRELRTYHYNCNIF